MNTKPSALCRRPVTTPRPPRYCAEAVTQAIAASNRAGRKIGAREARAIHALLRGRE